MVLRFTLFFSLVTSVLFIASCANNKADEIIPLVDSTCIATGHIVNYTEDIKPILETHCTLASLGACHQPGSLGGYYGLDYTTYDGIFVEYENGQLESRVLDLKDMPSSIATPPQTLSACDLLLIEEWIKGGAPEN